MAMRGQYLIPGRLCHFEPLLLCKLSDIKCQFGVVVQSEVASLRHVLENVRGSVGLSWPRALFSRKPLWGWVLFLDPLFMEEV